MKTCTCAYQGLRNVSFSENFMNVLNETIFAVLVKVYKVQFLNGNQMGK